MFQILASRAENKVFRKKTFGPKEVTCMSNLGYYIRRSFVTYTGNVVLLRY
jgi:hypothetical protein